MQGLGRRSLETLSQSLIPSLRGVALAYTGLARILLLMLRGGMVLVPAAPLAEPARQAVSSVVQPAGDALVGFFGGPPPAPPRPGRSFSAPTTIDVTISDAPLEVPAVEEEPAAAAEEPLAAAPARSVVFVPVPVLVPAPQDEV